MDREIGEVIFTATTAFVSAVAGFFDKRMARKLKKKVLRDRLSKGWKWRTFRSLCLSIREDETTTRELLLELGARASTKSKNVWTLAEE